MHFNAIGSVFVVPLLSNKLLQSFKKRFQENIILIYNQTKIDGKKGSKKLSFFNIDMGIIIIR